MSEQKTENDDGFKSLGKVQYKDAHIEIFIRETPEHIPFEEFKSSVKFMDKHIEEKYFRIWKEVGEHEMGKFAITPLGAKDPVTPSQGLRFIDAFSYIIHERMYLGKPYTRG